MGLSLEDLIPGAQGKAAGVFPADLARRLCSATKADWEAVGWIHSPQLEKYLADLNVLEENLYLVWNSSAILAGKNTRPASLELR